MSEDISEDIVAPAAAPALRFVKPLPQPAALNPPYYQSRIDSDLCISCGTCIERCPMDAIEAGDDGVSITIDGRCIGCGICVPMPRQQRPHGFLATLGILKGPAGGCSGLPAPA